MEEEEDFLLALRLQAEWEQEEAEAALVAVSFGSESPPGSPAPPRSLSVVDETWELLDPIPDVRALFLQFNETLFWGRLAAVEVAWSPRMTLCAGVCSYEGRGGMCSIRLSEPLLKLRPRKDLVETLLHEMIHALLFVTNNDKDHDSHGPEFCKHMRRINRLTGANVTIFHEFHDEVDSYRQHWWRCDGPCQNRKPYFGYVKRSMNRAPSARDLWWAEHKETCGGKFTKVKEPENYSKKGKGKTQKAKLPDSKPSDDKGKVHGGGRQNPIPFSGKGYQLGGRSNISWLEKITSPDFMRREMLLSQNSTSGTARPTPKNEIKFEQNGFSSSISSTYAVVASHKGTFASNHKLPKKSVSNSKAYTNVNGSPVKNVPFTGGKTTSRSTTVSWVSASLNETPKRTCFEPTGSPPRVWTASQGNSSSQDAGAPQKRTKLEDKIAFKNYFTKKEGPPSACRMSSPVKISTEPTMSSTSSSSTSDPDRKVSCPVCQTKVLESEINTHLDSCVS
uniref:DNA-dependent metalloprotease SPRTN n=1 Tax=Sphenodon punctatus TaxID=8508 RepID=A0A8D0H8P4_SPHPU